MIAIVVSRADRASEHVGEHLLDLADWSEREDDSRPDADGGGTYYRTEGFELRTFDELHIYVDDPARAFDEPDLLLFVSRHSGDTGPLLTAHFTGNFGPADYGGEEGRFARACPNAQATLVEAFVEHAPEGYEVGIECTHHGPSGVGVPSMFVELGSAEPEWEDPEGARAVARAALDLRGVDPDRERQLVGFGGGHYAPRFLRIVRETPWAVGHVGADWPLEAMGDPAENADVLRRAFEASAAEYAVVDGDRPELEAAVERLGYRVVSETWVREVADRPLDLVDRLERDLATVDEGLRFGDREASAGEVAVVDLPGELLAEAQGIDADAARDAVEANAVAFETEQSGTRAGGRAAVVDSVDRDAIVDDLAAVLERKYDAVEQVDGAVVARETAFDPAKARERGVPEGPAFGRLAAGEPVDVDGRVVEPAAVRRDRTRRFPT
ncbi:D-aminoacyl-tRNA deacylase [Halegenticoccus tardaugens]|uniref:D-aminoacyl-tRNA deacylase n=1 Tax=Halegenticoccus tardaugens TaxID=2071624 RepID=UPI00100BC252|nr:D-aminoacyl-tRNA deacylase [Halegenticoccus tardaugens]